ncbi:hypothetical protein K449DRAFT_461255 [Hypoxylon sp. EC38]|nr:hypothetical protein K449DRAFT_461255 [Hypoxylon sp. EC38]
MRNPSMLILAVLMGATAFVLPNQIPLIRGKSTRRMMLSDLKESTLLPAGCFCAGGSICCYFGDDADCDYGTCKKEDFAYSVGSSNISFVLLIIFGYDRFPSYCYVLRTDPAALIETAPEKAEHVEGGFSTSMRSVLKLIVHTMYDL